ncbi:GNAT family N-acetyltransferase [Motilibacter rhizosphaerae]
MSTDPADLDLDRVHQWLSVESYWATGRAREVTERAFAGSRVWSVLHDGEHVAVTRVVTDGATFAWVCDVFVAEEHRGRGLGQWMVAEAVADLRAEGVQRFLLGTRDAHEVYARVGFEPLAGPQRFMEIDDRPTRAAILAAVGAAG